jgi:hypothetical protein
MMNLNRQQGSLLIHQLLTDLREDTPEQEIAERLDLAATDYPRQRYDSINSDTLNEEIARFIQHLYRHGLVPSRQVNYRVALAEANYLLDSSYAGRRQGGYETAYLHISTTGSEGLEILFRDLTETVKERAIRRFTGWKWSILIDPTDKDLHRNIVEGLMDHFGQLLLGQDVAGGSDHWAKFYDADRLGNGNTLMASQQHQAVLEVNPAGEIVWQFRNYVRRFPIHDKIQNGRFEELDETGGPLHWVVAKRLSEGGGELAWTENASGKKCPGLAYDRSGALCLQQTRAVTPGKSYRVSGIIKAESVEGFACVQLAFIDAMGGLLCDATRSPRSELISGETPWDRVLFPAEAPEGAVAADLRLFINGKGKVFVDELFCFG